MHQYKFEYLDPETIIGSPDFRIVEAFLDITGRKEIGWHYIVDLAWIYALAKNWPRSYRILDAGGGAGPTQFLLAEMGFSVTNVDLFPQVPSDALVQRYGTRVTRLPSYSETDYVNHLRDRQPAQGLWRKLRRSAAATLIARRMAARVYRLRHETWRRKYEANDLGSIDWVQGNLCRIPEVPDASFDAVVSLSALEHIPLELLPLALAEISRVLKPQAKIALTTSGTDARNTWFHEPAKGWCFTSGDLARYFDAQPAAAQSPAQVLDNYRNSAYLCGRLAQFYRSSGANGMPWGHWDPTYIPVGVWR